MSTLIDIQPVMLTVPLPVGAVRWAGGDATFMTHTLVRIHTHDGLDGLGELYAGGLWVPRASAELLTYFGSLIIGMELNDLEQVERVVQRMHSAAQYWGRSGLPVEAISAIEVACLDLLGKREGVPVVDLLGAKHERLPVYASGGLAGTDDELRAELDRHVKAGYGRIKMRVGWGPDVDVNRVRVAREHLGDDIGLAVDAVKGHDPNPWTADQALELIRELQAFGLDWFEEPCAAEDIEGYARVRKAGRIPVSGGESTARLRGFERFVAAGALDILQPDSVVCGGILEMLKIDELAVSRGLRIAPHSWGSPVVLAANYHAGFAMQSCFTLERPVYKDELNDRLWVERPELGPDGMYARPTAPGLGIELSDDVIKEFAYQGEITCVRVPPVVESHNA